MKSSTGMIECTGSDDCPICRMFGKPAEQKTMFNVVDKADGKVKTMVMDQARFNEMLRTVNPSGRCARIRVGRFEVRFWWMWWKLSWFDKRSGTAPNCLFWMYGPWEFRKYWRE